MTSDSLPAGHVSVARRGYERVLAALAARELGVPAARVSVALGDQRGRMTVDLRGPVALAPDASIPDVAERVRATVSSEGRRLTGAEIALVRLRVTVASHRQTGRVS